MKWHQSILRVNGLAQRRDWGLEQGARGLCPSSPPLWLADIQLAETQFLI